MAYRVQVVGLDRLLAGLAAAPEIVRKESLQATQLATLAIEAEAKHEAPVKTGRLRSSIRSDVHATALGAEGDVSTNVEYAAAVEYGSRPHDIQARGGALMIPVAGSGFGGGRLSGAARSGQQVAFFRSVHHPGSQGRFFMKRGLERALPMVNLALAAAGRRIVASIKGI